MVAKLIPDNKELHAQLVDLPKSLWSVMEDMGSLSVAAAKTKLLAAQSSLARAAKKKGIARQQWWQDDSTTKKPKIKTEVNFAKPHSAEVEARLARMEGSLVAALSAANLGVNSTTNLFSASSPAPFLPATHPSTNPFAPSVEIAALGAATGQGGTSGAPSDPSAMMAQLHAQNQLLQ